MNIQPARQRSILLFARIGCAVVAAISAGLFAATLPTYIAYLNRFCAPVSCIYGQLSVGSDQGLRGLGISLSTYVALSVTLVIINGLLCTIVAALLLWRKSDSWIAVLMAFLLVILGVTNTIISPPILSPLLGAGAAAFIANFSNFLGAISLPLLFALFPNGRFVPRWTRWLIIAWTVPAIALTISPFFGTPPAVLPILSEILFSVSGLGLIGAQIYRYRRVSTPVEQQQTKWVVFGFSLVALIALSLTAPEGILSQSGQPYSPYMIVGLLAGSSIGIPIALCFGIAILRSHLYDIDVLINRTLVYGALSATLVATYAAFVILLQSALRPFTGGSELAVAASTLATLALVQPFRRRIQDAVDRRFYRRRYDAVRLLDAFGARLRDEVELDAVRTDLLDVVGRAVEPAHSSLWLRETTR